MSHGTGKDKGKIKDAPLWMWGIALLGLALVLGSIVFVLYEAAAGDSSPPDVMVQVDSPHSERFSGRVSGDQRGRLDSRGTNGGGRVEGRDGERRDQPHHHRIRSVTLRERGRAFLYTRPATI